MPGREPEPSRNPKPARPAPEVRPPEPPRRPDRHEGSGDSDYGASAYLNCAGVIRSEDQSGRPLAIAETDSSTDSSVRSPAEPRETMLRVGSLELDLINRTPKRGDRPIDLLPSEFRLLKYMMQRGGQLPTRAKLFQDVWHYKFLPETNLVDVHMGRLRRKLGGPNEAPMIRTVRGAGFILGATSTEKPSGEKQ